MAIEIYWNKTCRPSVFTSCKGFLKKRCLELVSLLYFSHDFWRKIFLLSYSINWPDFIVWLLLCRNILTFDKPFFTIPQREYLLNVIERHVIWFVHDLFQQIFTNVLVCCIWLWKSNCLLKWSVLKLLFLCWILL